MPLSSTNNDGFNSGFPITRDHGDHVRSRRLSTCQSLCWRVTAYSIRLNWWSCFLI